MTTHDASKPKKHARWRRHLRFTREGRVFVFVTFGLGFAAVNTGTNLMYLMFGFMLSLIILSGILSEHVLRRLKVQRRLPSRAFVGEPVLIEIVVRNGKEKLGSYSVEVEDHAENEPNDRRCYFLKVGAREEQVSTYRRVPKRRGRMLLTSFRVSTRFPFSLFEKWREIDADNELLVLPALIPTALSDAIGQQQGGDRGTSKGRGTETRELREYRSGDEMRAIHWRRSAALGKVVVRELELEAAQLLSIQLDNAQRVGDASFEADFEQRISRAASLVERAVARGYGVEICARGQRSPRLEGHAPPDAAWRFLALINAVDERTAPPMAQASRGARVVSLEQFEDAAPKDAA